MGNILLKVRDLKKTLISKERNFQLVDITFDLYTSKITALLGLNGAGKTTLIKLILGLLKPDYGSIQFNNMIYEKNIIKRINYLPETFAEINYDSTVNSFLKFMCNLNCIPKHLVENEILRILELVDLKNSKNQFVNMLSKGMKTRLGLAQSLIGNPMLIIFDEPTDGLDPQGRKDIVELIKNLKDNELSIMISSHILSEVENMADNILILHHGNLLANESIENITSLTNTEINQKNPLEDYFFHTINNGNNK